jgi:cullin 3
VDPEGQTTVAAVLRNVMLDLIGMERAGQVIDRSAIQHCVGMLESLSENDIADDTVRLYGSFFEEEFLETSREFYFREGENNVRSMDAGTFCKHAWKRLQEEAERCDKTISKSTEPKIKAVVEEELIRKHLKDVIALEGSGVKAMLDNNRTPELEVIYNLNSLVDPDKKDLSKAVQKRLEELGAEVNRSALNFKSSDNAEVEKATSRQPETTRNLQTAAAIQWVHEILKLKRQYDTIWVTSFNKDQGLQTAMNRSFAEFINACDRSQEYLSLFFDENLKKGIKGKSEAEVDALLEDGITLLRFIRDKDLFETYYKKHLSRRLITKRSVSMDSERQMIWKMKIEVGNAFTSKLEQMFKDMAVSEDLTAGFKKYIANLGDRDPSRTELEVSILTSTMWPMENVSQTKSDGTPQPVCRYPPALDRVKRGFEKFYHSKHNGRQLTWLPNLGTATIRATFAKNPHKQPRRELECSTFGTFTLLLFNDLPENEFLTFEDIQARTNIPTNELIRNLTSLSLNPKTKVLIKEPNSKEISPTDKFFFNESFDSKFVKVKIGVIAGAASRIEGIKERHETEKRQDEDRKHAMEAAIVRIMK